MNIIIWCVIVGVVSASVAVASCIIVRRIILKGRKDEIIRQAEIEAEKIKNDKIFQAKEKFLQLKEEHEKRVNEKNNAIRDAENRIRQKENSLNQQNSELGRKNKEAEAIRENLKAQLEVVSKKSEECDRLRAEAISQIENIAGMSAAQAKDQLIQHLKDEARTQAQS